MNDFERYLAERLKDLAFKAHYERARAAYLLEADRPDRASEIASPRRNSRPILKTPGMIVSRGPPGS